MKVDIIMRTLLGAILKFPIVWALGEKNHSIERYLIAAVMGTLARECYMKSLRQDI